MLGWAGDGLRVRFLESLIVSLSVLGLWSPVAGVEVFRLVNGAEVHGVVVAERNGVVAVDLGFRVVEVPLNVVAARVSGDGASDSGSKGSAAEEVTGIFFESELGGQTFREVPEWVGMLGEAVVLVETPTGLGSGFLVHPHGFVVTNDHVIAGETRIDVVFFREDSGGLVRERYDNVRIVATSPEMDLALLKIDREDGDEEAFPYVVIGGAETIAAGDDVFAIGSPLGLERSVSRGIVSLKNRLIEGKLYIQTTAQISPGNSGGPLFNRFGEVVGVNNMKVVGMGAEGLGFAIPAEFLKIFLRNRDAFAWDPANPNEGYRYPAPPVP